MSELVTPTPSGLYCSPGDFYIDPWKPVPRAVITHAHSDHLRWGCNTYLCSEIGKGVLSERVGTDSTIETLPYGGSVVHNGVRISLHPAGHILGSAQIRLEYSDEVWVVSGDYKTQPDQTCAPFEPISCNTFITESTFGLPIYHWKPEQDIFDEINAWWRNNQQRKWTSIVFCYSLGKAQRVLSGLDPSIGPIIVHGAPARFIPHYEAAGVRLPRVVRGTIDVAKRYKGRALVLAPPSCAGTPYLRKFAPNSLAFASGWMAIRGTRRRRSLDRGFLISDHADWEGLLTAIKATGAERIGVTHGYTDVLVRWLREHGHDAWVIPTLYQGETEEDATPPDDNSPDLPETESAD